MQKDPVCGMTGVIERHGQWFCSEHCAAVFARTPESKIQNPKSKIARWLGDPWTWVPTSGVVLATVGVWWPAAQPVSAIYIDYLRRMLAPLLLGLVLGGVIDHFVPKEYVIKLLAGQRKRVIARATLLGFLASSCSHGCLALTIELYRKGASTPAVVSFLLASPWASMSLTFLLLSLFGPPGLFIIVGALVIAWATGIIFQRLARHQLIDANPHTVELLEDFAIGRDLRRRWRQYAWTPRQLARDARGILDGMIPLGRMTLGWVQLGLALSAIFGALIPGSFFHRWLGPSLGGLALTLVAAAVMEVCSEGTAPVAFEIYKHTGALGNAFAFLMGGVVTDATELGALWTTIGRRTVFWMLMVTLPMVVTMGWLLNQWH